MSDDDSERFEAVKLAASNFRQRASFITAKPLFDINLSVAERTSKDKDEVVARLQEDGWEETGSLLGGKVGYFEKSSYNLTVIETRRGSAVIPSGPIRGNLLGNQAVSFSLNNE